MKVTIPIPPVMRFPGLKAYRDGVAVQSPDLVVNDAREVGGVLEVDVTPPPNWSDERLRAALVKGLRPKGSPSEVPPTVPIG